MPVPILSTKLYVPLPRANGVLRPRLTQRLRAVLDSPGAMILLSGPAGFGKTTLASEFVKSLPGPAAWVALDEGDNDPVRFWSYFITACQSLQAHFGEAALALLQMPQPSPLDAIPAILINEFSVGSPDAQEMVIVLDDFHVIQNDSIHNGLLFLVEHCPAKLHVVVVTRIDPPWPLARFRARNQLIEVRVQDLRFTTQEAQVFLNQMMGVALSSAQVASLDERTEGWAVGLQLAALSLRGRSDISGFVKTFTGSHAYIADYLMEEVLRQQPEEMQTFLLKTSLLERLNAGLCEALTGCVDGQSILLELHQMNLFITALDDERQWFRYHPLFADLLRVRLQKKLPAEVVSSMHQRAAGWYEQAGMISEAIGHALAAMNFKQAIAMVGKAALPMIMQARVNTLETWLQAIPQALLKDDPQMNLAYAWMNLLRGRFSQAEPYLKQLTEIFSTPGADCLSPSIQGEWLALQSELMNIQGNPAQSRDLANQSLQVLPETELYVRSMVYINLATAYQQMMDYEHAAETFQKLAQDARRAGDYISEILAISGRARMVLQQGLLHQAFEIAKEGIARIEASGKYTPFSATFYGELGQIYYYWHQLPEARSYLLRAMQASGQNGYSDPEIFYHVMLSRIQQMTGDWEGATLEMETAVEIGRKTPPAMTREEMVSQQVRVYLESGRLKDAQELIRAENFILDGDPFVFPDLIPGNPVAHPTGLLYNSALRILLLQSKTANLEFGIEIANHLLAGELQGRQIPVALETLLLRAKLHAALGRSSNWLEDVEQAVEMAEKEGFISAFVEEGASVKEALLHLQKKLPADSRRAAYIRMILAAFPASQRHEQPLPGEEPELVEALTARELEVLQWIAAGSSNQMIAEKLVITVSAVKKHTGNIFGKLNVNSRTQAVACARRLQLLPPDK